MALLVTGVCQNCSRQFKTTIGSGRMRPSVCPECKSEEADQKRNQHLNELASLTVEQRLRKLEEWVYDYKPPYRCEPRY